ncbi:hypothetical protein [Corynebacterium yonathiae]|uniref:Uncharacterized protein n=1 Tax=Corynebacterium yonathiae TaxID=2913504 RepID=A0ABU8Y5K0_9CORY
MYEPIPGYSHLKLFIAPHRVRYGRLPTSAEVATQHRIQDWVVFALEVAAGYRPLAHLNSARYSDAIRIHLGSWVPRRTSPYATEKLQLTSLHARPNGEYFGSVYIGKQQHAFTGSASPTGLASFRLL